MKRRDFLLLRNRHDTRVAELSCERLYMHYHSVGAIAGRGDRGETAGPSEWWDEEPPPVFSGRATDSLFGALARQLDGTDVLQISGTEWLAVDGLGEHVNRLLVGFRRRGGKVEYRTGNTTGPEASTSQ